MATPDTSPTRLSEMPVRPKTSFAGDVLKLVSGTTIAQLIAILASPILTRLYAPEAFGVVALFTSITGILGVVACLRYELAIMLPESDEDAANILGVSLLSALVISLLTVPLVWWGRDILLRWLNAPALAPYLWMVPPLVFLAGVFLALNFWNSRTKQFVRLSVTRVSQSVVTTAGQISFGFAGYATGGAMIGARLGGQAIATAVLGGQIWRDDRKLFLRAINRRVMVDQIIRFRKFPLYSTWSALLNTISWQLPALMLSVFFSSTVVGYYALGFRVLQIPMSLIGSSIGQVFFQRAGEAKNQGTLPHLVEEVFRRLVMIGLFPMLTLAIVAQDLFIVVFGSSWAEAGVYTQILALWAFFWFISSPISFLFNVLEKQEFGLKLNGVLLVTRLASLAIGGYLGSPRIALMLFAGTGILVYGYLSFAILAAAGVAWLKMWILLGEGLLYFAPFGALLITLSLANVERWLVLGVSLVSLLTYSLIIWKRQPELFQTRRSQ